MNTLNALLLDHDGTLVNSEIVHYEIWRDILADNHVVFPESWYREHSVGVSEVTCAAMLAEAFPVSCSAEKLLQEKRRRVQAHQQQSGYPPMAGADAFIRYFHRVGVKIAIASGSNYEDVKRSLLRQGWSEMVSVISTGDRVDNNKPAPDVYCRAMEELGVSPEASLAIEDTQTGLTAAVSAGVSCLAIPSEYSSHHDFQQATALLPNLLEAAEWIKSHWRIPE
ncbi:HAD family hydrolase [Marinibactrum halimedae]|uniref:Haloacid dehalogenase n=1 Tax=Marinibactrum halimedae TaxID=1444977 RepID=A0AA37T662_9GAMM|nr:HAD family phosphatase [Marinibactrum halimedae]MCD9460948.1 HAD family phosphatase [Marinibactrum halimedae]GLS27419.1 haloacid dehalogenase [Marinibactrum halimedae]